MITIFSGREINPSSQKSGIYIQVSVGLRDHIHEFNTGKSFSSFALFMEIALHSDSYGWAWPSRERMGRATGLSTKAALRTGINHLTQMKIEGHRVMAWYRCFDPQSGQWRGSIYRIFPDAWDSQFEGLPDKFKGLELILQERDQGQEQDPSSQSAEGEPGTDNHTLVARQGDIPEGDDPGVDNPGVDIRPQKNNYLFKDNHLEERSIPNTLSSENLFIGNTLRQDPPKREKEPEPPKDQPLPGMAPPWKGSPPPAARVFNSNMGRWPLKTSYHRIHETVGEEREDLIFWGEVVVTWRDLGFNPMNLDGMLGCYERRVLPSVNRSKKGNGRVQQTMDAISRVKAEIGSQGIYQSDGGIDQQQSVVTIHSADYSFID